MALASSILICLRSGCSRALTGGSGTKICSSSGLGGVGRRFRAGGVRGRCSRFSVGEELDEDEDDDDEEDDDEEDDEDEDEDEDDERECELDDDDELDERFRALGFDCDE